MKRGKKEYRWLDRSSFNTFLPSCSLIFLLSLSLFFLFLFSLCNSYTHSKLWELWSPTERRKFSPGWNGMRGSHSRENRWRALENERERDKSPADRILLLFSLSLCLKDCMRTRCHICFAQVCFTFYSILLPLFFFLKNNIEQNVAHLLREYSILLKREECSSHRIGWTRERERDNGWTTSTCISFFIPSGNQ